jgi:guanosine-diphosphatase
VISIQSHNADLLSAVPKSSFKAEFEDKKPPAPFIPPEPTHPDTPRPPKPAPAKPPASKPNPIISTPPKKVPTSPETDPDPLSTVYCKEAYTKDKALVQYAIIIDAGSQGSRIHVYKFNNCKSTVTLEYEVFEQTRPGLSAYYSDPAAAAESLDVLMDAAVRVVPSRLVNCTPLSVKATAGLRLLGANTSAQILASVRRHLRAKYKFEMGPQDRISIMDGKDEGVYAWITANYLLSTIGPHVDPGTSSYAVLDLGGASTQIVFEPSFGVKSDDKMLDGDHKYELSFTGKTHTLYQHSYLGYGLVRARVAVHNLIAFMAEFGNGATSLTASTSKPVVLSNPCLSKGTQRTITISNVGWHKDVNITMDGADVGSYKACNRIMELVMAKDAICPMKPCSFNGAYQPSILDTFPTGGILALSYFYDRIAPLIQSPSYASVFTSDGSVPNKLSISSISLLAQRVCEGASSWREHWGTDPAVLDELQQRPEYCLDLTFMHALLTLGYEFLDDRDVRIEKKIEGIELGWALGAGIALIDVNIQCTI